MSRVSLDTALVGFAIALSKGGWHRLAAIEKLRTVVQVDCGRQVGEQEGRGADAQEAAEAYRTWLHDRVDEWVDDFVAGLDP